jgi:hypothetical protein
MALAPLLIVFLMAFLLINKSIKPNFFFYLAVAVLSYSAYSCYPAWWYPSLAAFLGFFVIDVFRSKQFKSSLAFLAVFALVKFLSFDGDAAALNGVKAMVLKPSLYWEHYAMNFLGYFDLSKESHLILTLPDYVSGKIVYNVHLFTWLTFINWGLLLIIATILLVCNIKNIFTNKTWIFYLTALPGLAFPFLFDYILRPSEVYRFTAWGKLMLLLYIILNVGIQLQSKTGLLFKITKPLLVRIVLVFHLLLLCVPGVFSVLPSLGHFNYLSTDRLNESQKRALKVLMKYHQQDTTCLTTIIYYSFCDITNIAGYWGVGGQFYKPDLITRQTALYLLNPILLTDLKVTHVLIDVNQDKLSNEAVARINDRELFEEILELNQTKPEWRFYRFVGRRQYTAQELAQMQREYMWVLGSKPSGAEFVPAFQYSHYITGATRNQIKEAALIAKRDLISSGQIAAAVWLSPQAMANLKQ